MFAYFAVLNIYFRLFIFVLNPNNIWHWRIALQGILQDLVAASVFYLFFNFLFLLIGSKKIRLPLFLSFTVVWVLVNFANYEYADTFNKLLPLSWFAELINLNAMGSFAGLVSDYLNLQTLFQVVIPILISVFLVLRFYDKLLMPFKIKRLVLVFFFGSACQAATLDPGIQPRWDSTVHSQLLKYWYYSYDDIPYRAERKTPLKPFSEDFKTIVLEEAVSRQLTVPQVTLQKPNVVFILLESFRANEIGVFGSKLGITPNFDRYAKRGILFTEIYSSDHLTKTGQWSYLCGAHRHKGGHVLTFYKDQASFCLPDLLSERGYDNWWFHGQSASYDFQGYFMKRHQVNHIMDRLTFPQGAEPMGWGLADMDLMDHALNNLENAKDPFFWIVQTQSNHHPFVVPDEFNKDRGYPETINKFLNTFHYTDYSLGYFLERFLATAAGKNSVIVIAADHGSSKDLPDQKDIKKEDRLQKYQVPVLILYPVGQTIEPRKIDALGGQVDLMPTLLDILAIEPAIPIFGKSLVRNYKYRYAKGFLTSGDWFLTDNSLYVTSTQRVVLSKHGYKMPADKQEDRWFDFSTEVDDVQDWIVAQENRAILYDTLKKYGWQAN
jgi:phosphoglycerol transferase MdoB-like AlkP superfamily enzyme